MNHAPDEHPRAATPTQARRARSAAEPPVPHRDHAGAVEGTKVSAAVRQHGRKNMPTYPIASPELTHRPVSVRFATFRGRRFLLFGRFTDGLLALQRFLLRVVRIIRTGLSCNGSDQTDQGDHASNY